MGRERNERGRYVQTVTLADVLGVFEAVSGPVVTSGDVADQHGCSPDSARRKLAALEDRGLVESRRTAGRIVYWRTDRDASLPADETDRRTGTPEPTGLLEYVDEVLFGEEP